MKLKQNKNTQKTKNQPITTLSLDNSLEKLTLTESCNAHRYDTGKGYKQRSANRRDAKGRVQEKYRKGSFHCFLPLE